MDFTPPIRIFSSLYEFFEVSHWFSEKIFALIGKCRLLLMIQRQCQIFIESPTPVSSLNLGPSYVFKALLAHWSLFRLRVYCSFQGYKEILKVSLLTLSFRKYFMASARYSAISSPYWALEEGIINQCFLSRYSKTLPRTKASLIQDSAACLVRFMLRINNKLTDLQNSAAVFSNLLFSPLL